MKLSNFFLAAGFSFAMAFVFSCTGDDGIDGEGCSIASDEGGATITCGDKSVYISNGKDGEKGDDGIQGNKGDPGSDGESCTVESVDEGTKVTCGENSVIIPDGTDGDNGNDGANGSDGESCEAEQGSDGIITITCGGSTVGIAFCGEDNKLYNPINQLCEDGILKDFFTDSRDNTKYFYVEIGDYIWMTENLVYGKADGKYTWEEAVDACPAGWKLPTNEEWDSAIKEDESILVEILKENEGIWWSSDEFNQDRGESYELYNTNITNSSKIKTQTAFVRCVKAN